MDTYEARTQMLDLANGALDIVNRLALGTAPSGDDKRRFRQMLSEARAVLPDAGFPAEAAWRGIQRASIGVETSLEQSDPFYWQHVGEDLQAGIETLEMLVSTRSRRESDFHIVG